MGHRSCQNEERSKDGTTSSNHDKPASEDLPQRHRSRNGPVRVKVNREFARQVLRLRGRKPVLTRLGSQPANRPIERTMETSHLRHTVVRRARSNSRLLHTNIHHGCDSAHATSGRGKRGEPRNRTHARTAPLARACVVLRTCTIATQGSRGDLRRRVSCRARTVRRGKENDDGRGEKVEGRGRKRARRTRQRGRE